MATKEQIKKLIKKSLLQNDDSASNLSIYRVTKNSVIFSRIFDGKKIYNEIELNKRGLIWDVSFAAPPKFLNKIFK